VIVYLGRGVKRADIEYLRQLAPYAFVLPCMVYEGSTELQAVERARAKVRKGYEKFGVVWDRKKGMVFDTKNYERDEMLPLAIHIDALTNDEGPVDDFGELCNLLFQSSRLDWWRHWNVVKFIDWLRQQRIDENEMSELLRQEEESKRREEESRRQEEESRREDELRRQEELRRKEELRRQEEELRRQEDLRRQEEELRRQEKELRRQKEELRRQEEELRRQEELKSQEKLRRQDQTKGGASWW